MNLSRLMRHYNQSDFIIQLKVKFLLRLHFIVFSLFPPIIIYTAFINLNLMTHQETALTILTLEISGLLLMTGVFILLLRGHFAISAHLTVILLSMLVWSVMLSGKQVSITRLDTIVFLPAILSMTPLIISRKKSIILFYTAGNIITLFMFLFLFQKEATESTPVLLDYIADNTAALLIVGLVSYQIFSVMDKALKKAARDLREREVAEQNVLRACTSMETGFANSPTGIILADNTLTISYVNPAALAWSDLIPETTTGKSLREAFSSRIKSESLTSLEQRVREQLRTGEPVFKCHLSAVGKNENAVELAISVNSNFDEKGNDLGIVIFLSDITERVRMEEMMIQSEKMISVGGLAAGMAHEINNPLAAITQHAHLLRSRLTEESQKNSMTAEECGITVKAIQSYTEKRRINKSLDAIIQSVQRASQILGNMLSFTRRDVIEKTRQDLGQLADMTIDLAKKSYDLDKGYDFRSIQIEKDYESDLPRIICEAGEIQQVILIILTNGSQAMLKTPPAEGKPRFTLRTRREAEMVRLEIEDNGPGIDTETRKRIFEPFFTTKKQGIGTGLGLSIAYFIITENHQGTISVVSAPGMGAKFIVRLPVDQTNPT